MYLLFYSFLALFIHPTVHCNILMICIPLYIILCIMKILKFSQHLKRTNKDNKEMEKVLLDLTF